MSREIQAFDVRILPIYIQKLAVESNKMYCALSPLMVYNLLQSLFANRLPISEPGHNSVILGCHSMHMVIAMIFQT